MTQRRMQSAEMHRIHRGLQPNVIGRPIRHPALEPAAGHPHREARVVMVPPAAAL